MGTTSHILRNDLNFLYETLEKRQKMCSQDVGLIDVSATNSRFPTFWRLIESLSPYEDSPECHGGSIGEFTDIWEP